jgi:hypothetical protein
MSTGVRAGEGEGEGENTGDAEGDAHVGEPVTSAPVRRFATATTTAAAAITTTAATHATHHLRIARHASASLR